MANILSESLSLRGKRERRLKLECPVEQVLTLSISSLFLSAGGKMGPPGNGTPRARALVRKLWNLRLQSVRRRSTATPSSNQNAQPRSGRVGPVLSSAITCGGFSLLSDTMVQGMELHSAKRLEHEKAYDPVRATRMFGFGFLFYGPLQHFWYALLDRRFHRRSYFPHFASKVALNQVVLGPIVVMSVFTWNLVLQRKAHQLGEKVKKDYLASVVNGWKFWIPAASANFWLIPLQKQVFFMSACSIVWTGYLSYASNLATDNKKVERSNRAGSKA
mmetsp:Transcript_10446/g.31966  ORF Transcript_10446/g.31966 Transcript_10446/m.31966 type:complete len:275 (+) Transcript_10446:280-1104(+)